VKGNAAWTISPGWNISQLLAETWISPTWKDVFVVINLRLFLQKVESAAVVGQSRNHQTIQFIGLSLWRTKHEYGEPCMGGEAKLQVPT
jgi:hypothetical protein